MPFETPKFPEKPKVNVPAELGRMKEEREQEVQNMGLAAFLEEPIENRLTSITVPPLLPSSLEKDKELQFNFFGNRLLERQISLADVMPEKVRAVSIETQGSRLEGSRRGISGEFYTSDGRRLEIFTATKAIIQEINEAVIPTVSPDQIKEYLFPAHWDPKLRIPRGQVVAAASIVSPKY